MRCELAAGRSSIPQTSPRSSPSSSTRWRRPAFWVAVGKIIWINVLLSGDNALVIALACRGLAPRQRLWGMIFGAGAAVMLRIIFTGIVATLMELPYLKLVGGLALIVIAAKLLVPERGRGDGVACGFPSVGGGADRRGRRHRHEPRQRDRGRGRRQWQRAAADPRPCHQHSPDRRGRRADHGAAQPPADPGLGRRRAARLDRRRRDRDRSGDSAEAARAVRRSGRRQARRDAGVARHRAAFCSWRQRRRICLRACSASSSCWSRDRSGAGGQAAATPSTPRNGRRERLSTPNAARSIRSGRPAAPVA